MNTIKGFYLIIQISNKCKLKGGFLLHKTGRVQSIAEGAKLILEKLHNGEALEKFRQMIICQNVNETIANELCIHKNYDLVFEKRSSFKSYIKAHRSGILNWRNWFLKRNVWHLSLFEASSNRSMRFCWVTRVLNWAQVAQWPQTKYPSKLASDFSKQSGNKLI